MGKIKILRRIERAERGNFGDHKSVEAQFGKCVLTMAQDIACITQVRMKGFICFCADATTHHSKRIFGSPLKYGGTSMDKELLKVSKFDTADYLKNEADMQDYLEEVSSENAPQAFLQAINTIVLAKGMAKLSREAGIPRESLYHSL